MSEAPIQIKHPAKFSRPILNLMTALVMEEITKLDPAFRLQILDPFAGTGLVHELERIDPRVVTWGIEIEPEWAKMHPNKTLCADMREPVPQWENYFHIVATSPTYGNRMADHHNAKDASRRMTYKHVLGRDLTPGNSGMLHFGPEYKQFHIEAWEAVTRMIKRPQKKRVDPFEPAYPGGLFILNVSDFIRRGETVPVCNWHCETILSLGYDLELEYDVPTARLRYGANHKARVTHEKIFVFRRTMNR